MTTSSEESHQEGDGQSDTESDQTSTSSSSRSSYLSEASSETDSQCSKSNNRAVMHPSVEQPLFPGSEISVFQSHLLLYQFYIKHCLTNEGCMELLTLHKMHMPMSDNLPTSSYTLTRPPFFLIWYPAFIITALAATVIWKSQCLVLDMLVTQQ